MEFQIKPIVAADKARVLEISSDIWDGDDYIPYVFEDWLQDRHSDFVGLWADEKLIAFNRLLYLTPQDVWLEGLRKDQTSQIKGVTARLVNYHLTNIRQNPEVKSVRFSTYFNNLASVRYHEKNGFSKILELSLKELKWKKNQLPKLQSYSKLQAQFSGNLAEVVQFVENSNYLRQSGRFIVDSWTAYPYQAALIEKFYRKQQILELRSAGKIVAAAIFSPGKEQQSLWLNFLEASNSEFLNDLLQAVVEQAQRRNFQKLEIVIPSAWYDLDSFGFGSWEQEEDFWIYELQELADVNQKLTNI